MQATRQEIQRRGGDALVVPTDVTRSDETARLVDRALTVTGRIHALINVAGVGHVHSIAASDFDVENVLAVNLLAPIRLMRTVIPGMIANGGGSIINIGSIAGEVGVDGAYSASKFGLRGISDSVRREVFGTGVRVTLIEPGYIATPLTAGRHGRMPGPEVVADAVASALHRPRRKMIVPRRYRALAVLAATLPAVIDHRFARTAAEPGPLTSRAAGTAR